MLYKNLTTRELYASIPNRDYIVSMMEEGIREGSVQLAVSAMEELIKRHCDEDIEKVFDNACSKDELRPGSTMFSMITSSLTENRKKQIMASLYNSVENSGFKAMDASSEHAVRATLNSFVISPENTDALLKALESDFSNVEYYDIRGKKLSAEEIEEMQRKALNKFITYLHASYVKTQ